MAVDKMNRFWLNAFGPRRFSRTACVILVASATFASFAHARQPTLHFELPAQRLSTAILEFARQSGSEVFMPATLLEGLVSRPVHGAFTSQQALERPLACTGYDGAIEDGVVRLRPSQRDSNACDDATPRVS